MNPDSPPVAFFASLQQAEMTLLGAVASICNQSHSVDEATAIVEALFNRMAEHHEAVKGNRTGKVYVSWADLRLMMIGDLKIMLEELEKPT